MAQALRLAARARYWAAPNPHVGCVLVRDGRVLGAGYTQPPGQSHAEIMALRAAGDARGATAYVSLEPCSHHGRTPPCCEALIDAGVRRVVVATEDPDPRVSGAGIARLHAAGIEVRCGVLEPDARALIAGFITRMQRGHGRVRAKLAMSLDGRTAMASGESQWITGAAARADVQRLRAASCAILTGSGTVLSDDCALTVRRTALVPVPADAETGSREPLRVVLDSALRTPVTARVLAPPAPTLLVHGERVIERDVAQLAALPNVELMCLQTDSPDPDDDAHAVGAVDPVALLAELGARGCNEILLESGPRLAGALLRRGLIDELVVYMAPCLLGHHARPLFELPLAQMAQKLSLRTLDVRQVGEDWRFTLIPA
jgi:diaminohydroxyphosphoribosylaminopyrimidine deaminase/5-amino-6-(5-phosphoribosylamino)uracil reductase